jgi:RNA polymerase sigma-70 factor (ECF subfamily)
METGPLDVAACLERLRSRDEDAAQALVAHLYPLVMKIVRSYRARWAEDRDLAQMVFARLFNRLSQYRGNVPFEHWVSRIAVNTCLNQLRSERSRPELLWNDFAESESVLLERLLSDGDEPDPAALSSARDLANKLLLRLSPKDRLILTMLDLEGQSVSYVRAATGWGASQIKVRAFRARRKLRKQFELLMDERKRTT